MNNPTTHIVDVFFLPSKNAYQLTDTGGREAIVRKDLIEDNQLVILDGILHLSESLYEAWFKVQERRKKDEALFRPNVYLFFKNREFLLANPELCNIYSSHFGAYSYFSVSPSLGALMLSFIKGTRVIPCSKCSGTSHLFFSVGSVLSGLSSQNYICENERCQHVTVIRKGGMGEVVRYFMELNDAYLQMYPNAKLLKSLSFEEILIKLPA